MGLKLSALICASFLILGGMAACTHHGTQLPADLSSTKTFQIEGLEPKILQLALKARQQALKQNAVNRSNIVTIIDYSKPSNEKRLWVVDVSAQKVLHHTYVAHGVSSGRNKATHFSNANGSHKSSLGVFKTGAIYQGKHGLSLHLHGLEPHFNSNAYQRRIVVHGANYVSASSAPTGTAGHSHGCPALSYSDVKKVIHLIKDGTMLFAYYPDQSWLKKSHFVA